MTNGRPAQSVSSPRETRFSRRVSSLNISRPELSATSGPSFDGEPSPKATPDKPSSVPCNPLLTRQVSSDGLPALSEKENGKQPASEYGRFSPARCVSDFDKVTVVAFKKSDGEATATVDVPTKSAASENTELDRIFLSPHETSLRIEADLHPMRVILFRLMTNLNYNRKGIFNVPVDPVALGLADYFTVIKNPMDLGTIKTRLHSLAYTSRREVAEDVRLCFRNAMVYSPPHNVVHISAKELLSFFEDQVSCFCPDLAVSASSPVKAPLPSQGNEPDAVTGAGQAIHVSESSEVDTFSDGPTLTSPAVTPSSAASSDTLFCASAAEEPKFAPFFAPKRKKRGSKSKSGHQCHSCHGNVCAMCDQGCLPLESTLLICSGPQCAGAKVRKGATYYIAPDGSFQYCQRCYIGLSAVLPQSGKHEDAETCRYKRDLLKRKNDEEVVEQWIHCSQCQASVHRMCALYNPYIHDASTYRCPACCEEEANLPNPKRRIEDSSVASEMYSFVAGSDMPVPMTSIRNRNVVTGDELSAETLRVTAVSDFIERKVRERMVSTKFPNAEKTVVVRIISECDRFYKVPQVIRKHFQMQRVDDIRTGVVPPSKVLYRSKAIALFQKIDGLDVCIFCMYVQEYNVDDDEFEDPSQKAYVSQQKRVYIAYLDSVEHFRPRPLRTQVYQEVLTAYLASARMRGYEAAHIWACPPSRGNCFVFNNHPAAQRTPNMERLTAWYHSALSRAMDCGVVTDVSSIYESDFEEPMKQIKANTPSSSPSPNRMFCPPLLEGDFWIEEALRIHGITLARLAKDLTVTVEGSMSTVADDDRDPCPAIQVAAMIREKIIAHPSSVAFRRPVNAAAMNLKDYHIIITRPMDLGTVHSRCLLGEYGTLSDLVADVDLVFANARRFNPPGHVVHTAAIEVGNLFVAHLNDLTKLWIQPSKENDSFHLWKVCADMCMSLDTSLPHFERMVLVEGPSNTETAEASASRLVPSGDVVSCDEKSVASELSIPDTASMPSSPRVLLDGQVDGPGSIHLRMVGSDRWLLDKKNPVPPKGLGLAKKSKRGRKSTSDCADEPPSKRRRQTWLGETVGATVRRMRTSFFKCSLGGPESMANAGGATNKFTDYAGTFQSDGDATLRSSRVADARHALLEFSQFRNLEFDTLRRAKYSSSVLLYHLHNEGAPGLIPECTSCRKEIESVRWHRISRVIQIRPVPTLPNVGRKRKVETSNSFEAQELCSSCYSKHSDKELFIPLQVSI